MRFVSILSGLVTILMVQFSAFSADEKAADQPSNEIRQQVIQGANSVALSALAEQLPSIKTPLARSEFEFAIGALSFRLMQYDQAESYFQKSLLFPNGLEDYVYYHLGQIAFLRSDWSKARAHFLRVISFNPNHDIGMLTQYQLAQVYIQEKQWKSSQKILRTLERRQRRTPQYPFILYALVGVENALGQNGSSCRWAQKLHSQYPDHYQIVEWDIQLNKINVNERVLRCGATLRDQHRRIRNLQWAGLTDRARRELEQLQKSRFKKTSYEEDGAIAQFLIREGHVAEAFSILFGYYDEHQNQVPYLSLLAEGAGRAGEFDVAIAAYDKIYKLNPGGKGGRKALFSAALLCYQSQDYDGAERRFRNFVTKYGRSGLSRDAFWYLAWMQYLRGNYSVAYDRFSQLVKTPIFRSSRKKSVTDDRIKFWLAMTLMKSGKLVDAASLFQLLARDPSHSYYSIVAQYRLNKMKADLEARNLASVLTSGSTTPELAAQVIAEVSSDFEDSVKGTEVKEEDESEENMEISSQRSNPDEESDSNENESEISLSGMVVSEKAEGVNGQVASNEQERRGIQDRRFLPRFERAKQLLKFGFKDWAASDLREIERRSSNPTLMKSLIDEYELADNFYRSSYLSEIFFQQERVREGLNGGKQLWVSAYPQAYKQDVVKVAADLELPSELVWSIMRAESHFKYDVRSPVGAIGLMQLMPFTARQVARLMENDEFEVRQLHIPKVNIQLGARYLSRLMKKFSNAVALVAAGYNAGPHRVESWLKSFGNRDMDEFIEHIPYLETRGYVKKVVRNYHLYQELYNARGARLAWLSEPIGVKVVGELSARESWDP